MKTHVFRETGYSPSPITSLASNGTTIAVFRANKILELLDSVTLRVFVSIPTINATIIQSKFRDLNTLVALSDDQKILIIDITVLEIETLPLMALHMDLLYTEAAFSTRLFYYTNTSNHVCVMRGTQQTTLFREKSPITTLFTDEHNLIFATSTGWLRVLQKNNLASEINVGGVVKKICATGNGRYVAVGEEGTAFLFDANNGVVLDTVSIRKHSLNSVVFLNGLIHTSGVDSRIICYSVGDRLVKCGQADLHFSDVQCMAVDGNRVLTAGNDSLLVLNEYISGRYVCQRIYERSLIYGQTAKYFFVSGDSSINIYSPDYSRSSDTVRCLNRFNDKISFKTSEKTLETINPPRTRFPFVLKFKTKEKPRAVAISHNEQFIAYSTSTATHLYTFTTDSSLSINLVKSFDPSIQICFTDDYLIILDYSKRLMVYSLDTLTALFTLCLEDYRERFALLGNDILLTYSKHIISLNDTLSKLDNSHEYEVAELASFVRTIPIDGTVVESRTTPDAIVMLVKNDHGNSIVTYRNAEVSQEDLPGAKGDCVCIADENHYADASHLFVRESGKVKKYEIGPVSCGILCISDDVILLHSSWSYLLNKFKPSVFKEKYSNR